MVNAILSDEEEAGKLFNTQNNVYKYKESVCVLPYTYSASPHAHLINKWPLIPKSPAGEGVVPVL